MISRIDQDKVQDELSLYQKLARAAQNRDSASYFLGLEHHFTQTGPNGLHTCLVFRPMGPHLSQFIRGSPQFLHGDILDDLYVLPLAVAKRVLREVLLGLQHLHRNDIVHGDLHPGNILVNLNTQGFEATPASRLGQNPEEGDVLRRFDGRKDLWSPSYLISGANLKEFTSVDLDPLIKIADLGAGNVLQTTLPCSSLNDFITAFSVENSCSKTVTPAHLRSPESILGFELGSGVDVWSFGCLTYELITGRDLFRVIPLEGNKYDEETNDEHLIQIPEVLSSRLPEIFLDAWYRGPQYVDAEGNRLKPTPSSEPPTIEGSPTEGSGTEKLPGGHSTAQDPRDEYVEGMSHDFDARSEVSDMAVPLADPPPFQPLEALLNHDKPPDLSDGQENQILRLLHWILQIDPRNRPRVDDILSDPWFHAW